MRSAAENDISYNISPEDLEVLIQERVQTAMTEQELVTLEDTIIQATLSRDFDDFKEKLVSKFKHLEALKNLL